MERTVPRSATEEVDLYLRTIYSLLRSTAEVKIRAFEEVHEGMQSVLHLNARDETPDPSAFIYSLLRLPDCLPVLGTVILGQTTDLFVNSGYDVEHWQPVSAVARRRRCYFNGDNILACYIASRSDIDDIVPCMTAFQIEWNKLHLLLRHTHRGIIDGAASGDLTAIQELAKVMMISVDDLLRLITIWGGKFSQNMLTVMDHPCNLSVRLLGGSNSHYWRATRIWWEHIQRQCPMLLERPLYFVSSNMHSMSNLLSGFASQNENELIQFLERNNDNELREEWDRVVTRGNLGGKQNFLYYVLKKYQTSESSDEVSDRIEKFEKASGISRIRSEHFFDVDAQVFELSKLNPALFDPRLSKEDIDFLRQSDALVLNIDYPLGLAAYNLLAKVAEYAYPILGIYIMGKAATLNARIGDVMIPNVVHDEHSQNTYIFQTAFSASDITPFMSFGTVLDNQKTVSVLGTFLQTANYMDVFYTEGFSILEMESGPFLSAICEMVRPNRHPSNEIINLYMAPFDIGILHYVSDKPLSKGRNLGAGTLSYFGVESTYATSIAILRRIIELERKKIKGL